jgi:hypothetical protein
MKAELVLISMTVGILGFAAGLTAANIADAIAQVERLEAARDSDESARAARRQAWRDGTLKANTTTVRKSPTMRRVRQSTNAAMAMPPGFRIIVPAHVKR